MTETFTPEQLRERADDLDQEARALIHAPFQDNNSRLAAKLIISGAMLRFAADQRAAASQPDPQTEER
jgi:hypothetical protein